MKGRYKHVCRQCGGAFASRRPDALTCSEKCRKQRTRATCRVRDAESGRAELLAMLGKVPDYAVPQVRAEIGRILLEEGAEK